MAGIMRTPAFQDALPQAVRNIRNAGREPTALGFQLDHAGNIAGLDTLSTEGFDQVVRAMKDSSRAAAGVHPITGQPVHNTNSVHINARAKDLQDQLAAQNPAYGDAVGGYADEMAVRDALERGRDVAKLSGPEIAAQLRSMPPHALEAWTTGARTALADDAVNAGLRPGVNVAQRTRQAVGMSGAGLAPATGDTAKLQAIEMAAGRPGVVSRLDDRLEAEDQAYQTFGSAYRAAGSPNDRSGMADAITAALGPVSKAAMGNWKGALVDMTLRGNPRGTAGFRSAVDERTVELLSAVEPRAVRDAMGAVEGRRVADRSLALTFRQGGPCGHPAGRCPADRPSAGLCRRGCGAFPGLPSRRPFEHAVSARGIGQPPVLPSGVGLAVLFSAKLHLDRFSLGLDRRLRAWQPCPMQPKPS
jgi:hypothetical protein